MYDHYNFDDAAAYQIELAKRLKLEPLKKISTIAGADISFNKNSTTMYAGIVILTYPGMVLKSFALETYETSFPYKAGFLGFKEVPALLKVWELIADKPDVVVLDGNGILHPRHMGVASHFGILANHSTIGCAKSLLHGKNHEPENAKYSATEIKNNAGEMLGFALRTKINCAPVYISAGHLITQEESLDIIKKSVGNYRIPEPTHLAHNLVNDFRLGKLKAGFHEVTPPLTLF
ncbi:MULTISPECIES: endonuclease V [unclassified Pedobacter]|uniref:endonuclease V n=1 Tax=unclassified Pedobacter TaxID=2628915 RepID=UPI00142296DF|nr:MULTISPECIES: endonuclease V [unclassified Pedobacter]NII82902.1 deoxyribonuclease V [Pedobacter sp. SG908]NMN36920.1 deoxyribonuclease V [Pedobacter sp. SG918]